MGTEVDIERYHQIIEQLIPYNAQLVAVSKLKSINAIQQLYAEGQRDFGENYVQEVCEKQLQFMSEVNWHFIGHLQSNKVKQIAPFVHLIHGIDSLKLLKEVNKQAESNDRIIDVLLQIHISNEETKFGFSQQEFTEALSNDDFSSLKNIQLRGLMGMASFTNDQQILKKEFVGLKKLFDESKSTLINTTSFDILSMGMTNDYTLALDCGSTMVRIGSAIFGERK
jgi:pyridoxal phosphate enzyme (YggS family)